MHKRVLLSIIVLVSVIAVASHAAADIITFDPLTGPNGTPYSGHVEGDFTVTATGAWYEAFIVGNPTPSVFTFSLPVDLQVTENMGGDFTFAGLDLGTGSPVVGTYDYLLTGNLDGLFVYGTAGTFSGSFDGGFQTIANPFPLVVIDELDISFYNFDISSINVDNIEVSKAAVPEPATLLLIGTGLVGLVGLRRKYRN